MNINEAEEILKPLRTNFIDKEGVEILIRPYDHKKDREKLIETYLRLII